MERAAMNAAARGPRMTDGRRCSAAVMGFGRVIGDLIERARNEVDELHLGHRPQSQITHAYGAPTIAFR